MGSTLHVAVSVAESRISKRFDTIPTASLSPNEVMKKFNICKDFSCTRHVFLYFYNAFHLVKNRNTLFF